MPLQGCPARGPLRHRMAATAPAAFGAHPCPVSVSRRDGGGRPHRGSAPALRDAADLWPHGTPDAMIWLTPDETPLFSRTGVPGRGALVPGGCRSRGIRAQRGPRPATGRHPRGGYGEPSSGAVGDGCARRPLPGLVHVSTGFAEDLSAGRPREVRRQGLRGTSGGPVAGALRSAAAPRFEGGLHGQRTGRVAGGVLRRSPRFARPEGGSRQSLAHAALRAMRGPARHAGAVS